MAGNLINTHIAKFLARTADGIAGGRINFVTPVRCQVFRL